MDKPEAAEKKVLVATAALGQYEFWVDLRARGNKLRPARTRGR
jgi:hypothetical protein